jgi:hypothetical protein
VISQGLRKKIAMFVHPDAQILLLLFVWQKFIRNIPSIYSHYFNFLQKSFVLIPKNNVDESTTAKLFRKCLGHDLFDLSRV